MTYRVLATKLPWRSQLPFTNASVRLEAAAAARGEDAGGGMVAGVRAHANATDATNERHSNSLWR
jgi:hypothetical protein